MSALDSASKTKIRPALRTLSVAYTPDSDDAFNFFGWEHGPVTCPGFEARFSQACIARLNEAAAREEYDVVAISSVAYPSVADRYRILAVGSSVGRGYGPVLVSKDELPLAALSGKTVAVAALGTTGGVLARLYCPPGTRFVEMPFDAIAAAILRGEVDAGVMIHEELVHYPALGLRRVRDLGEAWTQETGLPLPVGLNVVRRDLGLEAATSISAACRDSLTWSMGHRDRAMRHVGSMGRSCAAAFVPMFSNQDTLRMPQDVRHALRVLLDRLADLGWRDRVGPLEVVDA